MVSDPYMADYSGVFARHTYVPHNKRALDSDHGSSVGHRVSSDNGWSFF